MVTQGERRGTALRAQAAAQLQARQQTGEVAAASLYAGKLALCPRQVAPATLLGYEVHACLQSTSSICWTVGSMLWALERTLAKKHMYAGAAGKEDAAQAAARADGARKKPRHDAK